MRAFLITLGWCCVLIAQPSFAVEKPAIAVIVAEDFPKNTISAAELRLIYWRKKDYWANGKRMHPVNLPVDNPLRMQFSNKILGSLPNTQNDYWNGLYFHGISPPHVVNSDEAVIRYVQETSGGIGYVDACKVDIRVKPIFWITSDGDMTNAVPSLNCD